MEPTGSSDNGTMLGTLFDQGAIALIRGHLFDKPPNPVFGRTDFDCVEGMLLGIAIGDSLGNTTEGMTPETRGDKYGTITDYLPGRYGSGVPSDDTQLAFWSLEQMLHDGRIDPELISDRFTKDQIFGIGQAVSEFLLNKNRGIAWQHCGARSAGNGALMRIAPAVLPHLRSATPDLWVDTALLSMVTHNDSASISSSLAFVNILWNLLGMKDAPSPEWWVKMYIDTTRDLEIYEEYQPRGGSFLEFRGTLWQFVQDHVPSAFDRGLSVRDACNSWYSGAYLLETVPSVLYILMTHGDDPEQAIVAAVNETKDNDTIAAIVGAAVGALHGKSAFPERWLTGLLGRTKANDDGSVFGLIDDARRIFWDIPSLPLEGTDTSSGERDGGDAAIEPSKRTVRRQARRRPAKELSVEVEGFEDLQIAEVEFSEESHPEEEGRNGERPVIDLTHRHFRLDATVAGKHYNFTGTWGSNTLSELLEVLSSEGRNLRCCQTCSKYRTSGMVADWSFGTEGYCLLRGEPKMEELTHMLHMCPFWQRRPELRG